MYTISTEFCLVTLLLSSIFIIHILHVLYLIIYRLDQQIKSIRYLLLNWSFASIIVAIWLIPFFYFRSLWSSESVAWRLWSFMFHIVDAVQIYSLILFLTVRSFQRLCICFIWIVPIIAYSPILWLPSSDSPIDYLPYRRFTIHVPWWILAVLYSTMYLMPMFIAFICSGIATIWPWVSSCWKQKKQTFSPVPMNEHHQDMRELTKLIETVLNFHVEPPSSTPPSLHKCRTAFVKPMPNKLDRSVSYQISQYHPSLFFNDLATSSTLFLHSSSSRRNHVCVQPTLNLVFLIFVITCLLLLIHFPYLFLAVLDKSTLQLSTFIYIHWLGNLWLPLIHLK